MGEGAVVACRRYTPLYRTFEDSDAFVEERRWDLCRKGLVGRNVQEKLRGVRDVWRHLRYGMGLLTERFGRELHVNLSIIHTVGWMASIGGGGGAGSAPGSFI